MKKIIKYILLGFFLLGINQTYAGIVGTFPTNGYFVKSSNGIKIIQPYNDDVGYGNASYGFRVYNESGNLLNIYNNNNYFQGGSDTPQIITFTSLKYDLFYIHSRNSYQVLIYNKQNNTFSEYGDYNQSLLRGFMFGNFLSTNQFVFNIDTGIFTSGNVSLDSLDIFNSNYLYRLSLNLLTFLNEDTKTYDYLVFSDEAQQVFETNVVFQTMSSLLGYNHLISSSGSQILSLYGNSEFQTYNPYDSYFNFGELSSKNEYYLGFDGDIPLKITGLNNSIINENYSVSNHQVLFYPYQVGDLKFIWFVDSSGNIYNNLVSSLSSYYGGFDSGDSGSNNGTEEGSFGSVINLFNKLKDLSNIVLNFFTEDIPSLISKLKEFLTSLINFGNTSESNNLFSFLFPSANASLVDDFFVQPTEQEDSTFLLKIIIFAKSWALLLVFVLLITILLLVYKNK